MNPRLAVVIGNRGVHLIRLISKDRKEQDECLELFQKVRKGLDKIDKELKKNA